MFIVQVRARALPFDGQYSDLVTKIRIVRENPNPVPPPPPKDTIPGYNPILNNARPSTTTTTWLSTIRSSLMIRLDGNNK